MLTLGRQSESNFPRVRFFFQMSFLHSAYKPCPVDGVYPKQSTINPLKNHDLKFKYSRNLEHIDIFPTPFHLFQLTSQHPYMETFVGKPYTHTIDINNLDLVESTIKEIISKEVILFPERTHSSGTYNLC